MTVTLVGGTHAHTLPQAHNVSKDGIQLPASRAILILPMLQVRALQLLRALLQRAGRSIVTQSSLVSTIAIRALAVATTMVTGKGMCCRCTTHLALTAVLACSPLCCSAIAWRRLEAGLLGCHGCHCACCAL